MLLTDKKCRQFQPSAKPFKRSDGHGLYLHVMPNGGKYWRMNYRYDGKGKTLSFGTYPKVSLKEARIQRDEARSQLQQGLDPSFEKKRARIKNLVSSGNTFQALASEWLDNRREGLSANYLKQLESLLKRDLYPLLGHYPIDRIAAPELLAVLRRIEDRGALDMAHRARQCCGQVFRYAIATGRAERDISHDLRGALKTRKTRSFSYLREDELWEFFRRLENYGGDDLTRLALEFVVLTFVRTTELRGALWGEIDFGKREWRIPAERMKMGRLHIVPLSKQAVSTLRKIETVSGTSEFLFPTSHDSRKHMSENTMLYAMYRLGYHSRATVHGFRATASTVLNENGFPPDVVERQLAHVERNKIRAAYNHAEYLKERREMMQWWADRLELLQEG